MKLRLLLSLNLLWLAVPISFAQALNPEDFFHDGVVNYLSNNIPKALEVVTNGRAIYPDDIKLKKLEELLKQQNQQQQKEQQKQDEKKDQQSKQDQQKQQDEKQSQDKKDPKDQQKEQPKDGQPKEKPDQKGEPPPPMQAHAMTPQEAKQLLDAQKGDEKVLQFAPQGEPKNRTKTLKDW